MTVKQLSIFLENKEGHLTDVAEILYKANINLSAFSMAETSDFGILRIIVNDPEKAKSILSDNGYTTIVNDVICLDLENVPGTMYKVLRILSDQKIFIDYMYAFSIIKARVIIKPNNMEKAIKILTDAKVNLKSQSDICN